MTYVNYSEPEILVRDLSNDELDSVSGGLIVIPTAIIAAGIAAATALVVAGATLGYNLGRDSALRDNED